MEERERKRVERRGVRPKRGEDRKKGREEAMWGRIKGYIHRRWRGGISKLSLVYKMTQS